MSRPDHGNGCLYCTAESLDAALGGLGSVRTATHTTFAIIVATGLEAVLAGLCPPHRSQHEAGVERIRVHMAEVQTS